MASTVVELPTTGRDTGKTTPEFVTTPHHPPTNFFLLDFTLRLFLLAATVSALVVMVTSKQTKRLPNPLTGTSMRKSANFDHSPAFIYLVSALSVTGFYSLITIFTSFFAVRNPSPSTKFLFNLLVIDALLAGVMASATGAAGAVAYIGLRGNSHVMWSKICNVYSRFCWHIGSSAFVSLVASIILVWLVFLSAYSLYRRSR